MARCREQRLPMRFEVKTEEGFRMDLEVFCDTFNKVCTRWIGGIRYWSELETRLAIMIRLLVHDSV